MTRPMMTFRSEDDARRLMVTRNLTRRDRSAIAVLVEGPDDGEWTVMDLRDAIENGFSYSWEV